MTSSLLVVQTCFHPATGVWSLMRDLTVWLKSQNGIRVALLLFIKPNWPRHQMDELRALGVPYRIVALRDYRGSYIVGMRPSVFSSQVESLIGQCSPDWTVIHSHNARNTGLMLPLRGDIAGRSAVVCTFHGMAGIDYTDPWYRRLFNLYLGHRIRRAGASLTSVDAWSLEPITDLLHLPKESFNIIPNGIADRAKPGCPSLRGTDRPFTVGFVGSLDSNKGWEIIAKAVDCLAAEGIPIRLVIAGDGPEAGRAEGWAQSRSYGQYLGFVPDAFRHILPSLDCLALLSKQEGMPIVLLEAMACGVPIIATRIKAIPEIIADGQSGFLVERNADDVIARLRILVSGRPALAYMHQASRELFLQKFSIDSAASRYLQLYTSLCKEQNTLVSRDCENTDGAIL